MEKLSLRETSKAVRGQAVNIEADTLIDKITTNSKDIGGHTLFVAIKGERFDGHDFVEEFMKNGGMAVLSEKELPVKNLILVEDTIKALGDLARYYREKFTLPVIGITGSVGKTSTRKMIAGVLSAGGLTHSTAGNLNNDIGLPLTLFNLEKTHKYSVIEMGMNHANEISYLTKIAKPEVAVITNVGTSHIGNLGSREGILNAKLEILDGLPKDGLVVLNGDDKLLYAQKDRLPFRTIYYGIDNDGCDLRAADIELGFAKSEFSLADAPDSRYVIEAPGRHHVYNALAAIAVGREYGLSLDEISKGIQSFEPESMRQNIIDLNGIKIIEDCYNASSDSMRAALEVLASFDRANRKIAVLGNILELGDFVEEEHRRVGGYVADNNIDLLVTVGKDAKYISDQAKAAGVTTAVFDDNQAAVDYLSREIKAGDAVLIKASRGARFEEISKGIQGHIYD